MNLILIAIAAIGLAAETPVPDFSGVWKQSNEQSSPRRRGDVTLTIQQRDAELIVETTSKGPTPRPLYSATPQMEQSRNPLAPMGTNIIRVRFGRTARWCSRSSRSRTASG